MVFNNNYKGDNYPNNKVNLAILDSNIALHQELENIVWTVDARSYNNPVNDSKHGTLIAGIIGAKKNGVGIAGINPNVNIYSIIVNEYCCPGFQGESSSEWVANGIRLAVEGPDQIVGTSDDADIISMSFDSLNNKSALFEAVVFAYQNNVTMVSASGNINERLINRTPVFPGAYEEVIAVGAICENKSLADFSNTGDFVELVAPGCNIKSTFINNDYVSASGTSFATPHVAGIVSLIISHYGHLPIGHFNDTNPSSIRGLLHIMATDLGISGYDRIFGYGLAQFFIN